MNEDYEEIDIMALKAKNRNALESMINEELAKPDMQELNDFLQTTRSKKGKPKEPTVRKAKKQQDTLYTFNGNVPLERRSSARIAKKTPEYTAGDLSDLEDEVSTNQRKRYINNPDVDVEDIETIVFRPRRSRGPGRRVAEVPFVAAEDVTQAYIDGIAWRVVSKRYAADGSSCHQCRQKTDDSKTYCRSGRCVGVRWQFCGVCLQHRYGENAAEALKDPRWACPPCRGICNCSICRARAGKRPTGILAPIAQNSGFRSVAHFLTHLQSVDTVVDEQEEAQSGKKTKKLINEGRDLLGFDDDGNEVFEAEE